uniref:Uncharacterized protein n=1 Tax=Knipowitschia caucasica TaxID=637954 RepID=A0AAV2L7P0_KNICA
MSWIITALSCFICKERLKNTQQEYSKKAREAHNESCWVWLYPRSQNFRNLSKYLKIKLVTMSSDIKQLFSVSSLLLTETCHVLEGVDLLHHFITEKEFLLPGNWSGSRLLHTLSDLSVRFKDITDPEVTAETEIL